MVDRQDNDGYTALHLAAVQGSTRIVRKLLIKGANTQIKSNDSNTAIDLAEHENFQNIVELLD